VIPCYNEEQRLPVEAFLAFAREQQSIGLLFVNDGSRDETLALLREIEEQEPDAVCVVDVQPNGGKAEAVRAGMLAACGSTSTVSSITLGLPVYDTQCGAKLFRVTPMLTDVLSQPFLSRWVFDVEILARFKKRVPWNDSPNWPVYEEPLRSWRDVGGSKVKPIDSLKAFRDLLRIRRSR
jgi:glycosyltransferase involved in cell wall biosynthesis